MSFSPQRIYYVLGRINIFKIACKTTIKMLDRTDLQEHKTGLNSIRLSVATGAVRLVF